MGHLENSSLHNSSLQNSSVRNYSVQPMLNISSHLSGVPMPLAQESGDIGFMMLSSTLLWIMVPGSGLFYSGMGRSKGALTMISLSLWSTVIVSIQWLLFGYSLSFSKSSSSLIGNFKKAFFLGVYEKEFETASGIPEIAFCFYQAVTATLPASLIVGALAERARVIPALLFIFIWTTLAFNPITYWSLNPNGWSFRLGILDFGGAAPVHVPAGAAALAYSYLLGPRSKEDIFAKPHNMLSLSIGTALMWFGSFGYNAGSAFGANIQAMMSCVVTNLSGAFGAITWALMDYRTDKNCSGFGLCVGAVVGLICITPASGFIAPVYSIAFGILGSVACHFSHQMKAYWKFDDALDVFAMHGIAGIVGMVLTGVFAEKAYGGEDIGKGGWLEGNWMQVPCQLMDLVCGFVWSFVVSIVTLFIINKIPGLQLRVDIVSEQMGVDAAEMGVTCYEHVDELKMDSIQYIRGAGIAGNLNPNLATKDDNNVKFINNASVGDVRPSALNNWRYYWH